MAAAVSLSLTEALREHLAALEKHLASRGLRLPENPSVRRQEEHVFALAFAESIDLELWFHLTGSRHAVYRRGRRLGISYVSATRPDMHFIDAICEYAFDKEVSLTEALLRARAAATDERVSQVHAAESVVEIMPTVAAGLAAAGFDGVRLVRTGENVVDVMAFHGGSEVRLQLRPLLGARNPFASGHSISITLPEDVPPGPGGERIGRLATLLLSVERDLAPLFRAARHSVRMTLHSGRQTLLPVGRLVRFLEGRLHESRGLIYLTSPCYANCVFCGEETTRDYVFSEVDEVLRSIRERDFEPERVAIGGFEPLSHPGILEMIAELRRTKVDRVELMTTGIPLANLRFVDALVDAGLTDVAVPLYGVDEATNDLIMRKAGAFRATLTGLDHLRDRGCTIKLHSIVVQQNVAQIDALFDLARDRWNASFVAAPPRVKQANFAAIAVRSEVFAEVVQKAPMLGVPFCHLPRMANHPDVQLDAPLQLTLEGIADSMRFYFSQEQLQLPDCAQCVYRNACTGVMASQLEIEPGLRVTPFRAVVEPDSGTS